jgi:hypothetical protein
MLCRAFGKFYIYWVNDVFFYILQRSLETTIYKKMMIMIICVFS